MPKTRKEVCNIKKKIGVFVRRDAEIGVQAHALVTYD